MEHHIRCESSLIAPYCLVAGSPRRTKRIAERLTDCELVTDSRGYYVYTGRYEGLPITACATNMGGASVAIAVEELAHMGATTFIRVGSCVALDPELKPGDTTITTAAVRQGGTTDRYLPPWFPAVATHEVTEALRSSATELHGSARLSLAWCSDSFYGPPPTDSEMTIVDRICASGTRIADMETDTLFVLGSFRGLRTGALQVVDGSYADIKPESAKERVLRGESENIDVALRALRKLGDADNAAPVGEQA